MLQWNHSTFFINNKMLFHIHILLISKRGFQDTFFSFVAGAAVKIVSRSWVSVLHSYTLFPNLIVPKYVHLCTSTYLRYVLFYTLIYIIRAALACSSCCWFKISSVLPFRKKSYLYKYNILGIMVAVVFVSYFFCI